MNRFQLLLSLAGLALGAAGLQAGTVAISGVGASQFASLEGGSLPTGSAVRVGTFNLSPATRDAKLSSTTSITLLKSWFKPLGEGFVGSGQLAQAGGSGSIVRVNSLPYPGDTFGVIKNISAEYIAPGTQLYLWIFNSANPDNASEWGIYTSPAWMAPQDLATQVLGFDISVVALQGSVDNSQLKLTSVPKSYANWTVQNFGSSALAGTVANDADPDGDHLSNLAEYAWGLRGGNFDEPRTAVAPNEETGITFTFKRPRNLPDVDVHAECSQDLITWTPATATTIASDAEFDTCQCIPTTNERCFWRVKFVVVTAP